VGEPLIGLQDGGDQAQGEIECRPSARIESGATDRRSFP
jgi:hypothetical protein